MIKDNLHIFYISMDLVKDSKCELHFCEPSTENGWLGWYTHGKSRINVTTNQSIEMKIATIIHELAHFYDFEVFKTPPGVPFRQSKYYDEEYVGANYLADRAEQLALYVEESLLKHLGIETDQDFSRPTSIGELIKAGFIINRMKQYFDDRLQESNI